MLFTECLKGGKTAAIHRCRAMDLFRGDVTGVLSPPLRLGCMDAAFIHKNHGRDRASCFCLYQAKPMFCRTLSRAGSLSQQGAPGAPLSLLAFSSLLPTRLTPKVALIGMGSDSHPLRLRNF